MNHLHLDCLKRAAILTRGNGEVGVRVGPRQFEGDDDYGGDGDDGDDDDAYDDYGDDGDDGGILMMVTV